MSKKVISIGANAPSRLKTSSLVFDTSIDVERYLSKIDKTIFERLSNEEWKKVIVDITKLDLATLSNFTKHEYGVIASPIISVYGVLDPLVSKDYLQEWANYTEREFSLKPFNGGHLDILKNSEFISWLIASSIGNDI